MKVPLFQQVQVLGAADKAASLGGESPLPSIAWFGRLAYPMHGSVTVRVLLGRRSHGCPVGLRAAAVGETWVANKPGGLNVRSGDDLETPAALKSPSGTMREADPLAGLGEGRRRGGRNRQKHPATRRDLDPSILGKTCRDNVGKDHLPAGAGSNLQRPLDIGGNHEVLAEEFGRAHELVRARKEG